MTAESEARSRIAVVIGASRGIGLEFCRQLAHREDIDLVLAGCRVVDAATELLRLTEELAGRIQPFGIDLTREETIETVAAELRGSSVRPSLVINTAGLLHDERMMPEKKLEDIKPDALARSFQINASGPALVAKHFVPLFEKGQRSVLATLSARVGSIGDNRLGGWYAYRASKAAQNMITRSVSIEAARRVPGLIVVGLHPGTVNTGLSSPFQTNVPADKLFSTDHSVTELLHVIDGLEPNDSGRVFDYAGNRIPE